ncbi:MAG: acetyl esterase/lipase [Planctomycetota bacterium]|jgi:acetyl esterase/lipase
MRLLLLACFIISSISVFAGDEMPDIMTAEELPTLGNPPADVRIPYGEGPLQFADLRLPDGAGPHPVIILIHGGCWLSEYDITYIGKFADALADNGIATWTVEYRRVGDEGGGWPGTFQDIAKSADHLLSVADEYSLDTTRVIASGHSAGGHLALWLAARKQFDNNALFSSSKQIQLKGVLGLAPAPDLAYLHKEGVCGDVIDKLMGGSPEEFPERYALGSATELVPLGLPQILVVGRHDESWKPVAHRYYQIAKAANDNVQLIEAAESGHFEMIDPDSSTWSMVLDAAYDLLGMTEIAEQK